MIVKFFCEWFSDFFWKTIKVFRSQLFLIVHLSEIVIAANFYELCNGHD